MGTGWSSGHRRRARCPPSRRSQPVQLPPRPEVRVGLGGRSELRGLKQRGGKIATWTKSVSGRRDRPSG
jgi:hypothetical protein